MRKFLLSAVCVLFLAGVTFAVEAIFVKFDGEKKTLTVKEGDKENTYKLTDKTKVSILDKDGNAKEAEVKVLSKAKEGKTKLDITTEKDTVTEVKVKLGKK